MSPRHPAFVLAWSVWGLWVVLAVVTLVTAWDLPLQSETFFVVALVGYTTVGAMVASRQPCNAVGWLLLVIPVGLTLQTLGEVYVFTRSNPGYETVALVAASLINIWLLLTVSLLPLLFPDGRLLSPRWRPVLWLDVAVLVGTMAVTLLSPGELEVGAAITNPIHVGGPVLPVVEAIEAASGFLLVPVVLLNAASLVFRFRGAQGRERLQVKWFAFAGLTAASGLLLAALGEVLPSSYGDTVGGIGWVTFVSLSMLGIPLATGVAVLRHHLYDIDVVINRTLVYGTLTAGLAATYVSSVLLLRLVLSPVAGDSALAVAGSTLAVAALFRPARARIQAVVDRRFYRSRYDAARTLDDFAQRLRHELDLDAVGADLCTAADRTVQPSHISLWLRP